MLTKEQACAMADTMVAPAAAERLRQAERRTARFLRVYPILNQAPASERTNLLREAQEYACKRWIFLLVAAYVLLAVGSPFISRAAGGAFPYVKISPPFGQLAFAGLLLLQHLYSQWFLNDEIPNRFPAGDSTKVISDS